MTTFYGTNERVADFTTGFCISAIFTFSGSWVVGDSFVFALPALIVALEDFLSVLAFATTSDAAALATEATPTAVRSPVPPAACAVESGSSSI